MNVADKLGFGPKREVIPSADGQSFEVRVTAPLMFNPERKTASVTLTARQYGAYLMWREGGAMIQDVLRDLSPNDREKLMSGVDDLNEEDE